MSIATMIESKPYLLSLEGQAYRDALIALHYADGRTLDRLGVTSAEISLWLDEAGITPPELTVVGEPMPAGDRLEQLDNYARRLAKDKRRAVLGAGNGVGDDVLQSEFLSLQGRASAKIRREANGRGKVGESDALDQLEAQAGALEEIDIALTIVRDKVADGTYTTETDVDGAPEWP